MPKSTPKARAIAAKPEAMAGSLRTTRAARQIGCRLTAACRLTAGCMNGVSSTPQYVHSAADPPRGKIESRRPQHTAAYFRRRRCRAVNGKKILSLRLIGLISQQVLVQIRAPAGAKKRRQLKLGDTGGFCVEQNGYKTPDSACLRNSLPGR